MKTIEKSTMQEKIILNWTEKESKKGGRVGAMYCFKCCDVMRN